MALAVLDAEFGPESFVNELPPSFSIRVVSLKIQSELSPVFRKPCRGNLKRRPFDFDRMPPYARLKNFNLAFRLPAQIFGQRLDVY